MILKYGELWSRWKEADLFLVTGNSTIRHNYLVMRGGSAGEAATRFASHRIRATLGGKVSANELKGEDGDLSIYRPYYLIVSDKWPAAKLGLFQTKEDYRKPADEFIISTACDELLKWISRGREVLGRDPLVAMPYPGIGLGQLDADDIRPYISRLPDCVEVWQYGQHAPIELHPHHPLAPLLEGDRSNYLLELCVMLDKSLAELQLMCENNGFKLGGYGDRGRLQFYLLIESFLESGDMNGAWHASRSKLREVLK